MSGRILVLSAVCLGLAACGTDKIAMSSEVGGGSSGTTFVRSMTSSGGSSAGPGGLGVTGESGAIENILGVDPVGGFLDATLGQGNLVSSILGSEGDRGLVPSIAAGLAGDPDAEIAGLGILGSGGLIADLTGTDPLGGLFDSDGVLGATLAGGNDGLLGALLDAHGIGSPLAPAVEPVVAARPVEMLTEGLGQVPSLGVTGAGGLVADVVGVDLVGNLVGPGTPLGGGNGGLLGNVLPAGEAPLAPIGDAVTGLLGVVAGSQPSPLAGEGALGPVLPSLTALLSTGNDAVGGIAAPLQQNLGQLPVIGDALGEPAAFGSTSPLGNLPVLGSLLGGR